MEWREMVKKLLELKWSSFVEMQKYKKTNIKLYISNCEDYMNYKRLVNLAKRIIRSIKKEFKINA